MTDTITLSVDLASDVVDRLRKRGFQDLTALEHDVILDRIEAAVKAMPRPVTKDDPPPWGAPVYRDVEWIGFYVGIDPTNADQTFVYVSKPGSETHFGDFDGDYTWRPAS